MSQRKQLPNRTNMAASTSGSSSSTSTKSADIVRNVTGLAGQPRRCFVFTPGRRLLQWRDDDGQLRPLKAAGIATRREFAGLAEPPPERVSRDSLEHSR